MALFPDPRRFQIQRACTCEACGSGGFHTVDTCADGLDALVDAANRQAQSGVAYRVVDVTSGETLR